VVDNELGYLKRLLTTLPEFAGWKLEWNDTYEVSAYGPEGYKNLVTTKELTTLRAKSTACINSMATAVQGESFKKDMFLLNPTCPDVEGMKFGARGGNRDRSGAAARKEPPAQEEKKKAGRKRRSNTGTAELKQASQPKKRKGDDDDGSGEEGDLTSAKPTAV